MTAFAHLDFGSEGCSVFVTMAFQSSTCPPCLGRCWFLLPFLWPNASSSDDAAAASTSATSAACKFASCSLVFSSFPGSFACFAATAACFAVSVAFSAATAACFATAAACSAATAACALSASFLKAMWIFSHISRVYPSVLFVSDPWHGVCVGWACLPGHLQLSSAFQIS